MFRGCGGQAAGGLLALRGGRMPASSLHEHQQVIEFRRLITQKNFLKFSIQYENEFENGGGDESR